MTESKFTSKLLKELRLRLPGAVIFKHNDIGTAGIPDISITNERRTIWLEIKDSENKKKDRLQTETLRRLGGFRITWLAGCKVAMINQNARGYVFKDLVNVIVNSVILSPCGDRLDD